MKFELQDCELTTNTARTRGEECDTADENVYHYQFIVRSTLRRQHLQAIISTNNITYTCTIQKL